MHPGQHRGAASRPIGRPRRRIISGLFAALLIASGSGTAGVVAAPPGNAVDNPDSIDNPDAFAYARKYGVTVDEAVQRLELQARAGDLSAWLDANAADWTGGLYVQHEPEFKVVVLATTAATPGLSDAVEGSLLTGLTSVVQVDHTLADLTLDAEALGNELPGALIRVDVRTNQVLIEGQSASAVDRAVDHVRPTANPKFIQSSRRVVPTAYIYAGKVLYYLGYAWCTSGFSVVRNSIRRTTTAAHCPDSLTNQGVSLSELDTQYGGSHDEQLMSTGSLTPTNRTHDGSHDTQTPGYRYITAKASRANQAIGSFYCRYGWASAGNFGCGTLVSKTSYGIMPNPALTSMWLEASDDDLASPGDSGGPVFTGGTALGIMHACVSEDPQCDNEVMRDDLIYVAINYVENGLDATVLTTP